MDSSLFRVDMSPLGLIAAPLSRFQETRCSVASTLTLSRSSFSWRTLGAGSQERHDPHWDLRDIGYMSTLTSTAATAWLFGVFVSRLESSQTNQPYSHALPGTQCSTTSSLPCLLSCSSRPTSPRQDPPLPCSPYCRGLS